GSCGTVPDGGPARCNVGIPDPADPASADCSHAENPIPSRRLHVRVGLWRSWSVEPSSPPPQMPSSCCPPIFMNVPRSAEATSWLKTRKISPQLSFTPIEFPTFVNNYFNPHKGIAMKKWHGVSAALAFAPALASAATVEFVNQ